MRFQSQVALLMLVPCFFIFAMTFYATFIIRSSSMSASENAKDRVFADEVRLLRLLQEVIKQRMDSAHQVLITQLQSLNNINRRMAHGDILLNDKFIPSVVSSVGLVQNIVDQETLSRISYSGLRLSFWLLYDNLKMIYYYYNLQFKRDKRSFTQLSQLDALTLKDLREAACIDALQRNYLYNSIKNIVTGVSTFSLSSLTSTYETSGLRFIIPTASTFNFVKNVYPNCAYTSKEYDSRCQPQYYVPKANLKIFFQPSTQLTTTARFFGTNICLPQADSMLGFIGVQCGRMNVTTYANVLLEISSNATFLVLHQDTKKVEYFNKTDKMMSQLTVSIPAKQNASELDAVLSTNFEALTAGAQEKILNGSKYFSKSDIFVSDTNQKQVLISSPVQVNEKVNLFNKASQEIYQSQAQSDMKYISMSSQDQMNHVYYLVQLLDKDSVIQPFVQIEKEISKIFITTLSILFLASLITAYLVYRMSYKFSMRIIIPIDRFIFLLKQVMIEDVSDENDSKIERTEKSYAELYDDYSDITSDTHQRNQLSNYDQNFSHSMTSYDTIVLYKAFIGLFSMLKYSNTEYYKNNPGTQLLKWIKSAQFFEDQKDRSALGICMMNIGNIHLNAKRYSEAMEAYQSAMIQANYELSVYTESFETDFSLNSSADQEEKTKYLEQLKLDRSFLYSVAFKYFCDNEESVHLWQEYVRFLKLLISKQNQLGSHHQKKVVMLIDYSFGKMKLAQLKKAQEKLEEAKNIIETIEITKNNPIYFLESPPISLKKITPIVESSKDCILESFLASESISPLKFSPTIKQQSSAATDLSRSISPLRKTNHFLTPFYTKNKIKNQNRIRKNHYNLNKNSLNPSPFQFQWSNMRQDVTDGVGNNNNNTKNYFQSSLSLKSISPYLFGKKHHNMLTKLPDLKQKSVSLASREDSPEKIGRQQQNTHRINRLEDGKSFLTRQVILESTDSEERKKFKLSVHQFLVEGSNKVDVPTMLSPENCLGSQNELSHSSNIIQGLSLQMIQPSIQSNEGNYPNIEGFDNNFNKLPTQNITPCNTLKNSGSIKDLSLLEIENEETAKISTNTNSKVDLMVKFNVDSLENQTDNNPKNNKIIRNNINTNNNNNNNNMQLFSKFREQYDTESNMSYEKSIVPLYRKTSISPQKTPNQQSPQLQKTSTRLITMGYSMANSQAFFSKEQYEYKIPSDILKSHVNIQEAKLLIEHKQYLKACEILTESLEEHSIYLQLYRTETVNLLCDCLHKLTELNSGDMHPSYYKQVMLPIRSQLNLNVCLELHIILDICDGILLNIVEMLLVSLYQTVLHSGNDRLSVNILNETVNEVMTSIERHQLTEFSMLGLFKQLNLLAKRYQKHYQPRYSLYTALLTQLQKISKDSKNGNRKSSSNKSISSENTDNLTQPYYQSFSNQAPIRRKFIIAAIQFDFLNENVFVEEQIIELLTNNSIELLILDLRQESENQAQPSRFEKRIEAMRDNMESLVKIFKDADNLICYLINIRINPKTFGIPLIVERFQSRN